jgi:hypothetical protein
MATSADSSGDSAFDSVGSASAKQASISIETPTPQRSSRCTVFQDV